MTEHMAALNHRHSFGSPNRTYLYAFQDITFYSKSIFGYIHCTNIDTIPYKGNYNMAKIIYF